MTPDELATAAKEMDENQNNLIEECEFMEYMKRMKRSFDIEKYTQQLFDQMVIGGSGSLKPKSALLSRSQMESFLFRLDPSLTKPDFELMWTELDTDADGSITREEFCQFMLNRKS